MSSTKKHLDTLDCEPIYLLSLEMQDHIFTVLGSLPGTAEGTPLARQPWSQACLRETHFSLDCASPNHRRVFKRPLKRLWSWSRIQRDRSENKGPSKPGSAEDGGVRESWGSANAGDDVKLPLTCPSCHARNKTLKEMKIKYSWSVFKIYMSTEWIIITIKHL